MNVFSQYGRRIVAGWIFAALWLWGAQMGVLRAAEAASGAAPSAGAAVAAATTTNAAAKAADDHGHAHGVADSDHGHGHGAAAEPTFLQQFGYSYLTAYMFCLSLCMGALFLVLVHHLFDAGWSVTVRRVSEQISAQLFPWMLILLLPILALQKQIYPWLRIADPASDHALHVKAMLFNPVAFNVLLVGLVASWGWIAHRFRAWSIAQDKDGAAIWTQKARVQAAWGIFYFGFTLTLVCFYLMKSLQHQFFSTMYGVYYFAGSVWTTLATMYALATMLSRPGGPLEKVIFKRQIQDLAVWFFAFTVFYAYIHFSQYFLIWNAAIPEETFWYVLREEGSWKWVGFLILFGHFFMPFLMLLNQDIKRNWMVMRFMVFWAWLMHYVDMTFNIMPVPHPHGLHVSLLDPICWIGMAGFLGMMFWQSFQKAAAYPLRDPRLVEAVTHHEIPGPGQTAAHH